MEPRLKKYIYIIYKKLMFLLFVTRKNMSKRCDLSIKEANEILQSHSKEPNASPICKNIIEKVQFDLTIIIPVYNVETFIEECIMSVLQQKTKYHYKVIVINDGSTDKSIEKIKPYIDSKKITIINQENLGIAAARNRGLQYIYSKYIMFVDSDDLLMDGAIDCLLDIAYSRDADIVQGSYLYLENLSMKVINRKSFKNAEDVPSNGVLPGMPWGKVYKSKLFERICFPKGYWYEDSIITGIITHLAKSIVTTSEFVYKYRQHDRSITKIGLAKSKSIDTLWVTKCILEARKELGFITDQDFYEHLIRQIVLNYKRTENQSEQVKQSIFIFTKTLLEKEYNVDLILKDRKYFELDSAIKNRDYGKYTFLCKYVL